MIRTFFSFLIMIVLLFCKQRNITEINVNQLKEMQKIGITIVDIRTTKEYLAGHIPGVVHNVDYLKNDFSTNMAQFDKSKPIVIHCARGGRSGEASFLLDEMGFVEIYDYVGGFKDWVKNGEEIEK